MLLIGLALIGLFISFYAWLLEQKLKKNPSYKPVCDLSDKISCTKPITSSYANLLYFSNSVWGMFYYLLITAVVLLGKFNLLTVITAGGVLASFVLAYILLFKIRSLCVLCVSLYVINILLFVMALSKNY
ncbi:MAG: vitamin K epoxide reductase family protein [Candidatus Dependentiae bacterium]